MNVRSASKVLALPRLSLRLGATILLLLAGAGVSFQAYAANGDLGDCDHLESSLRSLEVPVEELTADVDAPHPDAAQSISGNVPIVQLARRATNLSREVFAALPIVMLREDGREAEKSELLATEAADAAVESSPLVLAPVTPEAGNKIRDGAEANTPPQLPRFQQQMYRTDI